MTRRPLVVGLALAAVYAAVALGTLVLSPRPLRPLFDGFGPPPPYNWVKPPPDLAFGNSPPRATDLEVPLGPDGSPYVNATPEDGQAIVILEAGSVAARPPDEVARVQVTPLDAGTLGPLPGGLRAQGNAYRVTVTYRPSDTAAPTLARPGTIGLVGAGPAEELLFSADGQVWQPRPAQALGGSHGLTTELTAPGHYVVASRPAPAGASGGGGGASGVSVAVLALPPLALAGLALARRRRGRRPPPVSPTRGPRRSGPGPRPARRGGR